LQINKPVVVQLRHETCGSSIVSHPVFPKAKGLRKACGLHRSALTRFMQAPRWPLIVCATSKSKSKSKKKKKKKKVATTAGTATSERQKAKHTFQGREAASEKQLKIAELALSQNNGRKSLCFRRKLGIAREVACEQVLEDATMRRVRHCQLGSGFFVRGL
jgi:hypothetical protein